MKLLMYGLVALAIMGIIGTGVYKIKQWGGNEVRAEWEEEKATRREEEIQRSLAAATGLAKDRREANTRIKERIVYVNKYIETFVDSGQCFKPAGVSCLNGSIDGKGSAGCKPDGGVPPAGPSK